MKKAAFLFFFASFSTLVAAAGNDVVAPGDPQKEQKKESSFTLAQGYFNLFNIFSVTVPTPADTLRIKTPEPTQSSGAGKK